MQLDQPPLCYKAVPTGTSNPFPRFLPMISHDDHPPASKIAELLWTACVLVPIVYSFDIAIRARGLFMRVVTTLEY